MLAKCVLAFLELNWNQRFRDKQTKLNICHHMPTSSTQLQNRSFHVVERTRTSARCPKMKTARAKRVKLLFFIVKYANLQLSCCRRRRGCLSSLRPRPHEDANDSKRKVFYAFRPSVLTKTMKTLTVNP